jgi:dihydroorotase
MYDLLIRNGHVIDPAQSLDGRLDVAVSDGRIAEVAAQIDAAQARRVVDVDGDLVTPGLIDLHVHIYWGVTSVEVSDLNAPPDLIGVHSGVTTLLDAGSAGFWDLGGFARYVVPAAATRILALLSICRTSFLPSLLSDGDQLIDSEATMRAVEANRGLVRGIKLALNGPIVDLLGMEAVRRAVRVARATRTPLMVHIGDLRASPSPQAAALTREMLDLLRPGDILTHVCTARQGSVLDEQGHVLPELSAAKERGVVLDSAQGRTNFSFRACRRLMDQGIMPDVISSDLTWGGRAWIVYSLTECMAKFLALGLSISQVIEMTTANPAAALGMSDELGSLRVGREADMSILRLAHGEWEFSDSFGDTLRGDEALVPIATVRSGQIIMPDWGPHPWGWLPTPGPRGRRIIQ